MADHFDERFVTGPAPLEQVAYFLGQPVAMADQSFRALAGTMAMMVNENGAPQANAFVGQFNRQSQYSVTAGGTAVVPIHGTLIDRGAWMGNNCGSTSYEGLSEQFKRLAKDEGVKRVILDINSGGGMVAGIWDIFPGLDALKDKKPVVAIAQNFAASAAYAIASAAHEVVITRAGHVGSVGVIAQHMSVEKMMKRLGIDATLITSGAKKGQGNPFEALPASVKADWKKRVKKSHTQFIAHVSHYRPMGDDAVRETEAGLFEGSEAVEVGFADHVMGFDELLERFERNDSARETRKKGSKNKMSEPVEQGVVVAPQTSTSVPQVAASALDEAAIRADERQLTLARTSAILDSEEAVGREAQARHLALHTTQSADEAIGTLKVSSKEQVAKVEEPNNMAAAFAANMKLPKNAPALGPDSEVSGAEAVASGPSFADNLKAANIIEFKGNGS